MPSPPNQTAATARVISALPYEIVEDVADQASTLELWYTYAGQTDDRMIGALPYADISSVYDPKIYVYTGTASSLTIYHINGSTKRSVQVPSNVGTTYFFKVIQGGAGTPLGASLTFRLDRGPLLDAPAGSIISTLTATAADWRTPIISATTQQVLQFIQDSDFPRSAIGAVLESGVFIGDGDVSGDPDILSIYNPSLTRIYHGTPSYGTAPSIASNNLDLFYLIYDLGAGNVEVRTLTASGGESTDAWTLPVAASSFTVDRSNAILYYSAAGGIVKRYDLVNSTGLSNLAASIGAGYNPLEMYVMADGTILVGYRKVGGSPDNLIKRYDTSGAVLNTYSLGTDNLGLHHFSLGPNPLTFYVWYETDFGGPLTRNTYSELLASTGATVRSATYDAFNTGPDVVSYDPNYPDIDDVPRFGTADTCTFFVLRAAVASSNPLIYPSFNLASDPIRRVRQAPHLSNEQKWNYYHRFQLDFEAGGPRTSSTMEYQLQWSDDGGHSWSNLHTIHVGDEGQYRFRAIWRRLGRSRDRIFRVIDSNDDKSVWIDAFLDVTPGEH